MTDVLKELGLDQDRTPRLKVVAFGPHSAGKSHLALTFPNPIVVDTDDGTRLFRGRFQFAARTDIRSIQALKDFAEQVRRCQFDRPTTLVVDTMSAFARFARDDQRRKIRERAEAKNKNPDLAGWSATDWSDMRDPWAALLDIYLNGLPCYVVLTVHEAKQYAPGGSMRQIGVKPNAEPGLYEWADVMLRLEEKGADHIAYVVKDRSKLWRVGHQVWNPSFVDFARHVAAAEGKPIPQEAPRPERTSTEQRAPNGATAGPHVPATEPDEPPADQVEIPPIVRTIARVSLGLFCRPGPTPDHPKKTCRAYWLDWMRDKHQVDLGCSERAIETIMALSETDRGYLLGRLRGEWEPGSLWEDEGRYLDQCREEALSMMAKEFAERAAEQDRPSESSSPSTSESS